MLYIQHKGLSLCSSSYLVFEQHFSFLTKLLGSPKLQRSAAVIRRGISIPKKQSVNLLYPCTKTALNAVQTIMNEPFSGAVTNCSPCPSPVHVPRMVLVSLISFPFCSTPASKARQGVSVVRQCAHVTQT